MFQYYLFTLILLLNFNTPMSINCPIKVNINGLVYGKSLKCMFSNDDIGSSHTLKPIGQSSLDSKMFHTRHGIVRNSIARLPGTYFSTDNGETYIDWSYIIAICTYNMALISVDGTAFCKIKEKSIEHCHTTHADRSKEDCTAEYDMLATLTRKKELKPFDSQPFDSTRRVYFINKIKSYLELDHRIRQWFEHPQTITRSGGNNNNNNMNIDINNNNIPSRVGPGHVDTTQTCQINIHHKSYPFQIGLMLKKSQASSTKCKKEQYFNKKDCRDIVMSGFTPFMSSKAAAALFGTSFRNIKSSRDHHENFGVCHPRDSTSIASDTKFTKRRTKNCGDDQFNIDNPCEYEKLIIQTVPLWQKFSKPSSTATVKAKDLDGNEADINLVYLLRSPQEIWHEYDAMMTNECCRLSRSSFLKTKPQGFEKPTDKVCLCDVCAKSMDALVEIGRSFGENGGYLTTYNKIHAGGSPLWRAIGKY